MKVTMYPAISLDGFIAKLDGDSEWVVPEDERRYEREVERCGAVIAGRVTFDQYEQDFRARKNTTSFICTNDKNRKDEDFVKYISGTPVEMIEKVKSYGFDEVIVCGGGEINGLLASADLVDEILISICPITLGEGITLFGSHKPRLQLELISSNTDVPRVVQNRYKVIKV